MGQIEDEVKKHDKPNDAWVVYNGRVLDITSFLDNHPGGSDIIIPYLGKDITKAFDAETEHSENAIKMMDEMVVDLSNRTMEKPKRDLIDPTQGVVYQV